MTKDLRRCAVGALTIGVVVGGMAIALPANVTAAMEWHPATYGLAETPEQLLPATISTEQPARVVSTTLDDGRPVITVKTATNKAAAVQAVKDAQTAENAVGVELDAVVTATAIPTGSDTYRAQQWGFSKIRVADAWQKSTGAGVTVAVIDTGVDATHPDLNGHVLTGYNAIANTAGGNSDPNGHGTHVSGTIAAVTGNGVGVSAIAPDTTILPIKVLGANGSGYMSDTAEGIVWAADHGAGVINMSLGSTSKVTAVSNAITYARSKGVVVVASAGNSRASASPTNYPAADEGVIAVAATDSVDQIAGYSNAGSYVDVAAPGSNIISSYPAALGSAYVSMYGTSMASPHVAAVAALIKAYRPALTPDQVEATLTSSAVDLGTTGKDNDFGFGRIDAAAALAALTTDPSTPVTTAPASATPTPTAPTPTAPVTTAPATATPAPSKTTISPTPTPTKTTTSPTPGKTVTPTPSKPVVKVRPAIRVTASTTSVVYGTATTVTYTVTASGKAFAQQPVKIGVRAGGSAYAYTDASTDATGRVVFSRPATGRFQVKLDLPVTGTTLAVSSPVTTFTVRATATLSSPAAGSLKIVLTGAIGQNVQLQRSEKSRWVIAKRFTAAQTETTTTSLLRGATYRIVVPTTTAVTGLTSKAVRIS